MADAIDFPERFLAVLLPKHSCRNDKGVGEAQRDGTASVPGSRRSPGRRTGARNAPLHDRFCQDLAVFDAHAVGVL